MAMAPSSSLFAGAKIGAVTATCSGDLPQRNKDADGVRDQCQARADPRCPEGAELRTDVTGETDVCVVAGSAASTAAGKPPKCASGFRLRVAAGKDVCEKTGPPTCPAGFKLKPRPGEDQCHY
jgi:hypothetical protein